MHICLTGPNFQAFRVTILFRFVSVDTKRLKSGSNPMGTIFHQSVPYLPSIMCICTHGYLFYLAKWTNNCATDDCFHYFVVVK